MAEEEDLEADDLSFGKESALLVELDESLSEEDVESGDVAVGEESELVLIEFGEELGLGEEAELLPGAQAARGTTKAKMADKRRNFMGESFERNLLFYQLTPTGFRIIQSHFYQTTKLLAPLISCYACKLDVIADGQMG